MIRDQKFDFPVLVFTFFSRWTLDVGRWIALLSLKLRGKHVGRWTFNNTV